jgi:hypothetical protein
MIGWPGKDPFLVKLNICLLQSRMNFLNQAQQHRLASDP